MKWIVLSLLVVSILAFITILTTLYRLLLEIHNALPNINGELYNKDEE